MKKRLPGGDSSSVILVNLQCDQCENIMKNEKWKRGENSSSDAGKTPVIWERRCRKFDTENCQIDKIQAKPHGKYFV